MPQSASRAALPATSAFPPRRPRRPGPRGCGSSPAPAARRLRRPRSPARPDARTHARAHRRAEALRPDRRPPPARRRRGSSCRSSRCPSCRARSCPHAWSTRVLRGPDEMPSWAPRPVPTRSAVGVARPSAHGQAMIRTATAAANAKDGVRPGAEPEPEVRDGDRDHDRHEHAGDPVGEALHGRLAGLRLGDETADLRELGVGADADRPDDEAAADVDRWRRRPRRPAAPRPARSRRSGARRRSPRRPPRPRRRSPPSRRGGRRRGRRRRARRSGSAARRRPQRRRRPSHPGAAAPGARRRTALGARLEVTTGEDQGDDDRRHLEVDQAGGPRPGRRVGRSPSVIRAPRRRRRTARQRPAEGREHADRDQRVHRRRGVTQVQPGGAVERPRPPGDDGRASVSDSHCQ